MGDNLRLSLIGLFFVVVLGCIGFLLFQEEKVAPGVESSRSTRPTRQTDSSADLNLSSGSSPSAAASPRSSASEFDEELAATADEDSNDTPEEKAAKNAKRPRGPGIVSGVVTWHGDGSPVAGARVVLDYVLRENSYDPYPDDPARWTTQSDDRGQFRITNLPVNAVSGNRGGRLCVIAEKDGASAVTTAGLTDDETQTLIELELRPSGSISGQVLNGEGAPVAGAIVTPESIEEKGQERYSYGARNVWASTDKEGRFALANLVKGTWKLSVGATDYASEITEAFKTGEVNAKIVLKQGSSISGSVTEAKGGKAVPNIYVTVNDEKNGRNQQRVLTDKDGAFEATALADSDYVIRLDDEERILVGESPRVTLSNAEPVDGVELKIIDGGSVSGLVTDAETGAPISGIRIQARGNQPSTGRELQGISDASGFYRISGMPGGSFTLRRRWKEGYLHGESRENKTVSLQLGEALENIDFAVRRGLTISGIVVDKAGDPVQGVNVACNPIVDNGEGENVLTTEDGTFSLRGFSPNVDVEIRVSGRGYTAPKLGPLSTGDSGLEDIEIVVAPGASITGVVVDTAGKPLPDMFVSVASADGSFNNGSELTGPDGEFVIKSLDAGSYRLTVRRRNSWSQNQQGEQEVTVTQGQELTGVRLVFEAGPGSTISGRITNAAGEAIEGASVNAYSPTGGSSAYVQADTEGKYELTVDEGLSYNMQIHHPRYSHQQREGIEAGTRNLDVVLEGRGTVEGQVVDATTGRPIANFEITHSQGLANDEYSYQTSNYVSFYDEEGHFSIDTVEAGEATIYAKAAGYAPQIQHVPYVAPDDVTGGVQFRLQPGASIEGVVRDMQGAPVQNARIFLLAQVQPWMLNNNSSGAAATTDAEGRFDIHSVGEDLAKITAIHPDFPDTTVDVQLVHGQSTHVEIVMTGGATIEGTVYANGAPIANQHVFAQSLAQGQHRSTTDANGFYTLDKLPAGEVMIQAQVTRDGATKSQNKTVTVEAGFTTTVDLSVDFGSGAIEGTITIGGQAISEGFVVASMPGEDSAGQQVQGVVSPNATYAISGLSTGTYRVMFHAVAAGSTQRQMRVIDTTVTDGQTTRLDVEIDEGAHIQGIVSGISSAGQSQVIAVNGNIQTDNIATLFTSPDFQANVAGFSMVEAGGAFDVGGLGGGTYTVFAVEIGSNGFDGARFASATVEVGSTGTVELNIAIP